MNQHSGIDDDDDDERKEMMCALCFSTMCCESLHIPHKTKNILTTEQNRHRLSIVALSMAGNLEGTGFMGAVGGSTQSFYRNPFAPRRPK